MSSQSKSSLRSFASAFTPTFLVGASWRESFLPSLGVCCTILLCATWVHAQAPRPGESFALPDANIKPVDMVISSSGQAILFAAQSEDPHRRRYMLFQIASGTVKDIVTTGPGSLAASPTGNLFAIAVQTPTAYELIVLEQDGTLAGLQRHPQRLWDPQFSSDGRDILLRSFAPGTSQPSNDLEFSLCAIYGVFDQQFRTVLVSPPGLSLRRAMGTGGVFVFPIADVKTGGVRLYETTGTPGTSRPGARGTSLSATGMYYISPQLDPRGPFAVFEAATHRQLREFNRSGSKPGEFVAALRWHPKNDRWLAAWRDAADGSRSLEILDAENGRTVRSIYKWDPSQGPLPWAWAPDGSSIVIFHSGKFWFEPIK